jgi:hypothetical protein
MSLGVPRREYSLASKVLHWLMPWRVPVYDSFVRGTLGVPGAWDHPKAYRKVTSEIFTMTQTMTCQNRLMDGTGNSGVVS